MNNFRDIRAQFVESLVEKRGNYVILIRCITGYVNTNKRLYKMGVVNSLDCRCGFSPQDLNHIFWACPLLVVQRQKLCNRLIQLKMQQPFSIEYVLDNINKRLAIMIYKFMHKSESILSLKM